MHSFTYFHHPDISFTVLKRRAVEEFLDMVDCYGAKLSRAEPLYWSSCFPSQDARNSALYRLRKSGMIVQTMGGGKTPLLRLTEPHSRKREINPKRFWNQKWSGIWNVLVYDVPEKDKTYRNTLRKFLKRMRMGCLQKSVWISPRDIRPEYDDLRLATGVDGFSFLFESRTVLGRRAADLVHAAWDFDQLSREYKWYMESCERNADAIQNERMTMELLETVAREEMVTYRTILEHDPLLPRKLLPYDYKGPDAYTAHSDFVGTVKKALSRSL